MFNLHYNVPNKPIYSSGTAYLLKCMAVLTYNNYCIPCIRAMFMNVV